MRPARAACCCGPTARLGHCRRGHGQAGRCRHRCSRSSGGRSAGGGCAVSAVCRGAVHFKVGGHQAAGALHCHPVDHGAGHGLRRGNKGRQAKSKERVGGRLKWLPGHACMSHGRGYAPQATGHTQQSQCPHVLGCSIPTSFPKPASAHLQQAGRHAHKQRVRAAASRHQLPPRLEECLDGAERASRAAHRAVRGVQVHARLDDVAGHGDKHGGHARSGPCEGER